MVRPLTDVLRIVFEMVTEVIESELVVRAVGDVGRIGFLARDRTQELMYDLEGTELIAFLIECGLVLHVCGVIYIGTVGIDDADRETQGGIYLPHPDRIAAREIIVHRDDVDAFCGERVQERRQGRDERLAFAGAHLRDGPVMEDEAADELDIEMPLIERTHRCLAYGRERLGQEIIERLPRLDAVPEVVGEAFELFVRTRLHGAFERVHAFDHPLRPPQERVCTL